MYDIFIKTSFAAGHHLRDYPGDCEQPHGHNWHVQVTVRAHELDHLGMGIDFRTVKNAVKESISTLDHRNLNDHPSFQTINPSSENIAAYLFNSLKGVLVSDRYRLQSVTVGETDSSGVTYFAD